MSETSALTVEPGLLARLPGQLPAATGTFLLTDRNVEPLLSRDWRGVPRLVIAPGEASKSWGCLGELLAALDAAGLDRDGQLVAVGGGVVTDLGGLGASLHRRGIRWVAVPTSLVGQVDAAIGGKTAVNLGGGKNTVGSFHQPVAVLVDPRALRSLPPRHLRAGFAEMLKTALIAGDPLWRAVGQLAPDAPDEEALVACIKGCMETKLELVASDPRDHGERRLLNLGHTFGHAFEALAMRRAPDELLHGEAVGLGLLCAARLAAELRARPPGAAAELEEVLRERLRAWQLPCTHRVDADDVWAEMGRDKKRLAGALTAVVPEAPGAVVVREGVPEGLIRAALEAVQPG